MLRKPFEEILGNDPALKAQVLKDNEGRIPDNFIESADGGIDSEERKEETPTEEHRLRAGFRSQLRAAKPWIDSSGLWPPDESP